MRSRTCLCLSHRTEHKSWMEYCLGNQPVKNGAHSRPRLIVRHEMLASAILFWQFARISKSKQIHCKTGKFLGNYTVNTICKSNIDNLHSDLGYSAWSTPHKIKWTTFFFLERPYYRQVWSYVAQAGFTFVVLLPLLSECLGTNPWKG